jgi:hypothetical protein
LTAPSNRPTAQQEIGRRSLNTCVLTFLEWALLETRSLVDPGVLNSYERAFHEGLEALIGRTTDPALRQAFAAMRQFQFANYIVGALVKNGLHQQYDPEDCLQRIVFRMLSPVGERGLSRSSLFDLDLTRPYNLQIGNPLEARFKTYLANELRNISTGRIPALRRTQRPGSLSIGYSSQDPGMVSPDEIPGRTASSEEELLNDILAMLKQRSSPAMPLADLFQSIMAGEGTRVQRQRFGHDRADRGRQIIVQIIRQYAYQTQNWHLVQLLDRFQDCDATRPDPRRQPPPPRKPSKPVYPPDEADYRSIVQVVDRNGGNASMMHFGKDRRRWLERPPRDPNSAHPNRLADVLARMVQDGVLAKQGARYVPGPNYGRFLPEPAAAS